MTNRWGAKLLVAVLVAVVFSLVGAAQRRGGGQGEEASRFRFLGPAVGNRIAAVAGVPGDPDTYYAGAASGGVWKTTDGGMTLDADLRRPAGAAIGALAVAPSDPNIVWAGTGEAWAIRDADVDGRRRLQVDRRRHDLDEHGPDRDRPHRPHHRPPDEPRHRLRLRRRAARPARSRSAASSARPTAASTGSACSSSTRTPAAPASSMDAKNPSTLFAGTWQVVMHTVGDVQRRRRAAASTCRATAGRRGRRSRTPACRSRRSARSTSRSRRRTRSASTR